jgi:hypothetical protein
MNGTPALDAIAWSRRRWVWTAISVLALQIILIFWLSERAPLPRPATPRISDASLVLDSGTPSELAPELAALDPTLFALPNPHNFSGSAWSNLPQQRNLVSYWADAQPLFAINAPLSATSAAFPIPSPVTAFPPIANKPQPRWLETLIPEATLTAVSAATIEGGLRSRPVVYMPAWPTWPWGEPASNSTVIQLWVDPDGLVRETGLWNESGISEADRYAVREAKQIRFKRSDQKEDAPLTWGTLVVRWGTLPPVAAK